MLSLVKDPKLLQLILLTVPLLIGLFYLLSPLTARKNGTAPVGEASPERKNHHRIGIMEGISFLLLMGVAVPIKRLTGDGSWVTIVGSLHGALFVLYIVAVFLAAPVMKWRGATTLLALIASVVPFGTFALEWYLARQPKVKTA